MFELEKKLRKSGKKRIVGLDEAGRGAMAGPLTVGAVMILDPFGFKYRFPGIRDSKKLNEKERERICASLIRSPDLIWNVSFVFWKTIDRCNVLNATKIAMRRSVKKIEKKTGFYPGYLLIDGNFKINSKTEELSIIKGDETVFSCMAAGIIAKVFRDKAMRKYSVKYPQYSFLKNKGYGTRQHRKAISDYGHCRIHRKSFNFKTD